VNLADARFGHAKNFGDFAQAQIFKIIKRENFALHFGKLFEALGNHGLRVLPSEANFALVLFEGELSAAAALHGLAEAGYAVRHLPGQGLPHGLRITIGTREQMDEIAATLRTLAGGAR